MQGSPRRLFTALLTAAALMAMTATADAALVVHDQLDGATPQSMAQSLAGNGVTISNVLYIGNQRAGGQFTGGNGILGFDGGVVLGSGKVQTKAGDGSNSRGVEGPNGADNNSTNFGTPGDPQLSQLAGGPTNDAATLQFSFVPAQNTVSFRYVFSSDEYNEYVNQFNDVFAFYVNGQNCATVPGPNGPEPVSINTINKGKNAQLYRNNDPSDGPPTIDTEMDGLTVVLTCSANVNAGQPNTMKLSIADALDTSLDSNVFIQAGSFTSGPPPGGGKKPTKTTYTGPTSGDYHDSVTLSGHLDDTSGGGSAPLSGKTLTFSIGNQSCSGTTNGSGNASCSLVLNQQPGSNYTVKAAFAGDSSYEPSSDSKPFTITREETVLTYTGPTQLRNGSSATLSGVLREDDNATPVSGRTVTFTLGGGSTAQSCSGVTDVNGRASCSITVSQPTGPNTVKSAFAGDAFYEPSSDSDAVLVYAGASSGAFVIGDKSATQNASVTFWGAQWAKQNSLSGGGAPSAFKGFADGSSTNPKCGDTFTASPGNSGKPPATVPAYMAVIVASSITKSGSTIKGTVRRVVIVKTDPGYGPSPGHPGTGKVVAEVCHS